MLLVIEKASFYIELLVSGYGKHIIVEHPKQNTIVY